MYVCECDLIFFPCASLCYVNKQLCFLDTSENWHGYSGMYMMSSDTYQGVCNIPRLGKQNRKQKVKMIIFIAIGLIRIGGLCRLP